ncbi:MAG: hypothetical protein KHW87_04230 [Clostridiales bacterium]|nr:hypothetical protein [Clostridiales bacterium]
MNKEMASDVKELRRIGELYACKKALSNELDDLAFEEKEELETQNDNFVANLFQYQAKQAKKLKIPKNNIIIKKSIPVPPQNPKDPTMGAIVGIIFFVSLPLFIVSFILSIFSITIPFLSQIFGILAQVSFYAAIVCGIAWFVYFSSIVNQYLSYKEKLNDWENAAKASLVKGQNERFYSECIEFENTFLALTKACDTYYEAEKEKKSIVIENIQKAFSKKHDHLNNQLENTEMQLNAVTLIHLDLFGNALHIAKLLETGRADTLKEAINLAFDEDRKDAEEEARQIEAARKEAILEQQAEETRIHQRALERAAREHNAAMEREAREHNLVMQAAAREQNNIAREQNRLEKEQNNIARKQNEVTHADLTRCYACKNYGHGCHGGIHNCAAFVSKH